MRGLLVKSFFSNQNLFYMRPFPKELISFSSNQGKEIFKEAMNDGTIESYFPLSEQFLTQSEPSTCGPSTLVMVLNALKIEPETQWKSQYNTIFFNIIDQIVYGNDGLSNSQLEEGIHLDDLTHIARHNKVAIQTFYHEKNRKNSITLDKYYSCKDQCERPITHQLKTSSRSTFKLCLKASSRKDGLYLIVNCFRKALGQTGTGHFSPIGGINERRNLALLFDVARFKYPPQWCNIDLLYDSMEYIDPDTKMCRGFSLLSRPITYSLDSRGNPDSQSLQEFQIWCAQNQLKINNLDRNIQLPKCFELLLVQYLFDLLERVNQNKFHINKQDLEQALPLEKQQILESNDLLVERQPAIKQLIEDFCYSFSECVGYLIYLYLYKQHISQALPDSLLSEIQTIQTYFEI